MMSDKFRLTTEQIEAMRVNAVADIAADKHFSIHPLAANDLCERVLAAEATARAEQNIVYVPGHWHCPKCNFTLLQSNLNTADGSVTARDDTGDKCPNCASPLWRVSWKQYAKDGWEQAERYFDELAAAKKAQS